MSGPKPAPTLFHEEAIASLRALNVPGQPDFVLELARDYLAALSRNISTIQDAFARGDFATAQTTSHALKSSSALLGLLALSELCRRLEKEAHAQSPTKELYLELDRLAQDSADSLRAALGLN